MVRVKPPRRVAWHHYSGDITAVTTDTHKAFTLLELIVVIVILGILAALAIPTFNAIIGRAKDSNVKTAAASFDRNVRALAAFDEASPNVKAHVDTAIGEAATSGVTAVANQGGAALGFYEDVTITQDGTSVCLTLGTASGVAGTTAAGQCASGGSPGTITLASASTGSTGTLQSFTAPFSGTYRIRAQGAQGGNSTVFTGGLGARMESDVYLIVNQHVTILVGQKGGNNPEPDRAGGGGGGTFVYDGATLLVAASGGGGAGTYDQTTRQGAVTSNGQLGQPGGQGYNSQGGTNGNGALGGSWSGGGGGWASNGGNGYTNLGIGGGLAPSNGGTGGLATNTFYPGGDGGYGGGGGESGGGGAGGYSGGGGGWSNSGSGGGGGSFSAGSNQSNVAGVRSGHGRVDIAYGGATLPAP